MLNKTFSSFENNQCNPMTLFKEFNLIVLSASLTKTFPSFLPSCLTVADLSADRGVQVERPGSTVGRQQDSQEHV